MSIQDDKPFRELMADVKPLRAERVPSQRPKPPPVPHQRQRDERLVLEASLADGAAEQELETGEELLFLRPGVQQATLRRLRRGQYAVQATLDLHGMTAAQARREVGEFLRYCRERALRCVRIVPGKGRGSPQGRGVLRAKLATWLRRRDEVLAFCSARPCDGGSGAAYVLLRRGA